MILTGQEIEAERAKGAITLEPFSKELLNPNSYNYRLGDHLLLMDEDILDVARKPQTRKIIIPKQGYVLEPGRVYLGYTAETIGSQQYVPSLIGRSSMGRLGLFLQITADLGHLGTSHKWTLELKVVQPLRVYAGMRIGQVSFWLPEGADLLEGKSYADLPSSYARYSIAYASAIEKLLR